jgi:GNAT superfamily N-acetyltransferase
MTLSTRLATPEDAPTIGALLDAIDLHYRGEAARRDPADAIAAVRTWFADGEGTEFLLGFNDDKPCGIACFVIARPGRALAGLLFLKDLFVGEPARGLGLGKVLLQALADIAVSRGIGRMEFNTDPTNTGAQRLYDRLGGTRLEKISYRFEGEALRELAGSS